MENNKKSLIRLGIIGMSNGNGHPYSWSAIFNGYNSVEMADCPFPIIPEYLAKQSFPEDCISGATVTHIWTQDKDTSKKIASCSKIPYIVDEPEDMIDLVDAILLARDDAENHFQMSIPFLDAGLPVYIDKPIAVDSETLDAILAHEQYPGQIFSCSALRFAKEFNLCEAELAELGRIEYVEAIVSKSWRTYGVHIIEPVLSLLNLCGQNALITAVHKQDKHIVVADWHDISVSFTTFGNIPTPIIIRLYGTKFMRELIFQDVFSAFKKTLQIFIEGFTHRRYMITHSELKGVVSIIERGAL